jgi:hypothetical protein
MEEVGGKLENLLGSLGLLFYLLLFFIGKLKNKKKEEENSKELAKLILILGNFGI